MADVVRRMEDVIHIHVDILLHVVHVVNHLAVNLLRGQRSLERGISIRQHHRSLRTALDGSPVKISTLLQTHHGLFHKQLLLVLAQLTPVPIGNDIVQHIRGAVATHLNAFLVNDSLIVEVLIVGIEVLLHVNELQLTIRVGRDGQRDVLLTDVCRGRTGIGRDYLVVDVDGTLHKPVVCL